MKNTFVLVIFLVFLSLGCQNDNGPIELTDINIRAKNTDTIVVETFSINFETIVFEDIKLGETTEYQPWPYDYRPDIFELRTERGTYGPVIYDYVPEAYLMEKGFYTIELDGSNSFDFVKDR